MNGPVVTSLVGDKPSLYGVKRGRRVVKSVAVGDTEMGRYISLTRIHYCHACKKYHAIDAFRPSKKTTWGLDSRCRASRKKEEAAYRAAEPEWKRTRRIDMVLGYGDDNPAYVRWNNRRGHLKRRIEKLEADYKYALAYEYSGRNALSSEIAKCHQELGRIERKIGTPTGSKSGKGALAQGCKVTTKRKRNKAPMSQCNTGT